MRSTGGLQRKEWDELVALLEPLHAGGLEMVARDHIEPQSNQIRLEPAEMWSLLGGAEGLRRMQANADVMVALAGYASRWNLVEAAIVAERMRQDAILLRRALFRIRVDRALHRRPLRLPFYLQQAASSYYLMQRRLLCLYETTHAGLRPQLAAAL
ncbi:hypothetical protein ESZ00_08785 [Silvibacterium dinghuense]|uniref:Uncharacterized protein n=2 Tax=Silvibacterium dinghuense TaxID=1560006 RepID=A0A4Q1SM27_9BACT|nr:hypothetical protein ESZ00_08785 [Silvibacterium dinghuense]